MLLIAVQSNGEDMVSVKPEPNAAGLLPGDEIIDSDLDDSDDEQRDDADEEGEGDLDIVFCTYEKVSLSCQGLTAPELIEFRFRGLRISGRRHSKTGWYI